MVVRTLYAASVDPFPTNTLRFVAKNLPDIPKYTRAALQGAESARHAHAHAEVNHSNQSPPLTFSFRLAVPVFCCREGGRVSLQSWSFILFSWEENEKRVIESLGVEIGKEETVMKKVCSM